MVWFCYRFCTFCLLSNNPSPTFCDALDTNQLLQITLCSNLQKYSDASLFQRSSSTSKLSLLWCRAPDINDALNCNLQSCTQMLLLVRDFALVSSTLQQNCLVRTTMFRNLCLKASFTSSNIWIRAKNQFLNLSLIWQHQFCPFWQVCNNAVYPSISLVFNSIIMLIWLHPYVHFCNWSKIELFQLHYLLSNKWFDQNDPEALYPFWH